MNIIYTFLKSPLSYAQIISIPFEDIEKIDFALCAQPTETPDKYYKRQARKPDILTNGGFFSMNNGLTCFGYIDEGQVISYSYYPGAALSNAKTLALTDDAGGCRDFISGYPVLVKNGKKEPITIAKEIDYNARRTAIGWNDTHYFVIVVDSPGVRFAVLQDLFIAAGAHSAINLDGGGSTRLLVDGKLKTAQSYARPVDNVMAVYLKKEEEKPKTIYRVQIGAFAKKENADNFLADVKQKGFTDAYVKKVGIYYKVQVGAYSVKLNAERMKDRLIALGYKPFITTK